MSSESPSPQRAIVARFQGFARFAGVTSVAVGGFVMAGWILDLGALKSVLPGAATMKPNTALAFFFSGTALALASRDRPPRRAAMLAAALMAGLIGVLTLGEYVLGTDFGIDRVLFPSAVRAEAGPAPGRMAPATALGFSLLAAALLLRDRRRRMAAVAADALAIASTLIGLLAVLGYAYGADTLYRFSPFSLMALHTAALFFLLGLGTLMVRPDEGLTAVVASDSDGGLMARRSLPLAVVLPLFFGWLRLEGERAGYYGLEFGLAAFALTNIGVFCLLIWLGARELNLVDARRRQATEELRRTDQRLGAATAAGRIGIWDWDLASGRLDWTRVNEELWDMAPGEFRGTADEAIRRVHPEDRAGLQAAVHTAIAERAQYQHEFRLIRPDGSIRWIQGRGTALYDEAGRAARMTGVAIDITARRQAETALRETEARFSTAFHSSPVALLIATAAGKFVEINPAFCELIGYTRDEALGRSAAELGVLSAADRDRLVAAIVAAGGSVRNAELKLRCKDGRQRDVLYSVSQVLVNDQPHRLSTGVDVTERKQAEGALAAALDRSQVLARRLLEVQESERRQLARDLHDELGQTLTAMKIHLQTVGLDGAAASLASSVELVDHALAQTRSLSLGLRPPLLDDLGIAPALRWLADQQSQQTGRRITLFAEPELPRPAASVETACFRLAQEAITNALRHGQAATIALELRARDRHLQLSVRDDGVGFDLAAARERAVLGGSLGLLGMEERALLAGGRIEWRSAPGGGTDVIARFPLSPATAFVDCAGL